MPRANGIVLAVKISNGGDIEVADASWGAGK